MTKTTLTAAVLTLAATTAANAAFINEFDSDQPSTDNAEFVEIALAPGESIADFSLVLYNGASTQRSPYGTLSSFNVGASQGGFTLYSTPLLPSNSIQNGDPDGIALIRGGTSVIEFLSYGGSFTAASGVAAGMTSTNIGVVDTSGSPNVSVQRTGTGDQASDFTFVTAAPSRNAVNAGQSFQPAPTNSDPEFTMDVFAFEQEAGSTGSFAVTATDVDADDILAFSADGDLPDFVTFNPDGTFTSEPTTAGFFSFGVTVDDGSGGLDTATVNLTVIPEPLAAGAAGLMGLVALRRRRA